MTKPYSHEVCAGFDSKTVSGVLMKHGYLIPGKNGKTAQSINGTSLGKTTRCYVISSKLFDSEDR